MSNPLVSVCIPTYNGAKYIEAALKSVFNQTYANIEIIISDDSSSDNTLEIIESNLTISKFPISIYHHTPSGIGANWNHCLKQANGTYIKFLFQDDLLMPGCIEEMYQVFKENKQLGLVSCKRAILFESNVAQEKIENWLNIYEDLQGDLNLNYNPVGIIDKRFFRTKQFFRIPVNVVGEPSAVMFRCDLLERIGYFREDMTQFLDFEYWYRILKQKDIAIINKKLVKFRIHANQATQQNKGKMQNDVTIFKKLLYKEYFWLLNRSRQKQLFLQFHPLGKFLSKYLNIK